MTRLFYYPVKSLAGVETRTLQLTRRGPAWDREWMLVDAAGTFLSQRTLPRMCLLRTALEKDALRLEFPGASPLRVSLGLEGKPRRRVVVWDEGGDAFDEGDAAAGRLSAFLAAPCRLVRFAPGFSRREHAAFADDHPLLVVNAASLADLGRRAGRDFEAERFRPNIVVTGAPAWSEDGWTTLARKGLVLRAAKPCARCAITTVDPATGERGPEPLKTLASFRRGADGDVLFGVNCAPEAAGRLRVGDELETSAI